jgi:hypothetical protein
LAFRAQLASRFGLQVDAQPVCLGELGLDLLERWYSGRVLAPRLAVLRLAAATVERRSCFAVFCFSSRETAARERI